jgi:SanA protein
MNTEQRDHKLSKTMTLTRKSRCFRLFIRAVIFVIVVMFGLTTWTLTVRYTDQIYTLEELESVPERQVALVFGAGYWKDGTPSDILKDRIDAAIELFRAGRVEKLLFSGDNRVVEYNEPAKMREYALSQGIGDEAIVLDYAGRQTYDTCYRARDIFQVDEVILVTQRYHVSRALATCEGLRIDAIGYIADRTPYVHIRWYWIREIPALWKTWWDLYINHTTPVLGDPLPIFP